MTLVFWQNMVSIHQSALLKHLAQDNRVILVAAQSFEQNRKDSGWSLPDMGATEIVTAPEADTINRYLFGLTDAIHIFSGITAYPLVYSAFKEACKKKLRIFVYMEPYETAGIKGKLRVLYYRLLALQYGRYISAILATGETGVKAYRKAGFNSQRIFEWGYFTEATHSEAFYPPKNNKRQVLFVGRLDDNKQVLTLIQTFLAHCGDSAELAIVGTGPLRSKVEQMAARHDFIHYMGVIPNDELKKIMQAYDLLVLPSLYDGWGCVVNEALQAGMQVLCSDACGASALIKKPYLGIVFSWNKPHDFETKLRTLAHTPSLTAAHRIQIAEWAGHHISAEWAGIYLHHIINHTNGNSPSVPVPPWKTDK